MLLGVNMDFNEINRCIDQLNQDETTYSNCQKLASLLIIREFNIPHPKSSRTDENNTVERELSDILPHYIQYCNIKVNYQRHNIGKEPVLEALVSVCKEVGEFLQSLYSHTDMPEERKLLEDLVNNFTFL